MMAISSAIVGDVRQQLADPGAALPALLELVRRAQQLGMPLDEREPLVLQQLVGAGLHVVLDQLRLVVEQVLLRRRAGHVQVDDALGPRRELRRLDGQRDCRVAPAAAACALARQERAQRDRAHAGLAVLEEMPARLGPDMLEVQVHHYLLAVQRFGQHAVEIQEHVGHDRPGGQLGGVMPAGSGPSGSVAICTAASASCR